VIAVRGDPTIHVGTPHLLAALLAGALATTILAGGRALAVYLERKTLPEIAPKTFPLKTRGLVFQRAAAGAPGILPLYGSSELVKRAENKAGDFFRGAPTGFEVSPVGAGGITSIIILQKLAALGPNLEGRKIAISLSPSWFLRTTVNPELYDGNFSSRAASEIMFNGSLGLELKHDIASRMLQFPDSFTKNPLLDLAIKCFDSPRSLDRALFWCLWPLGKMQNLVFDLQDHFAALTHILQMAKPKVLRHRRTLKPKSVVIHAGSVAIDAPQENRKHNPPALDDDMRRGGDAAFLARMDAAMEWRDFELLLRTLTEIHARPLLFCIPMDGISYDEAGISRSARQKFYATLQALADRYNFPLIEFQEHDEDPTFLVAHKYHLSGTGWMAYNRALDDFFHDRALKSVTK
jgi:D-alanine transfer protein